MWLDVLAVSSTGKAAEPPQGKAYKLYQYFVKS